MKSFSLSTAALLLLACGARAQDAWTTAPVLAHKLARQAQAVQPALPPVEQFIRRRYFEGMPYALASQYTPADAQALLLLLKDPALAPYYDNIVSVIGAIGDPKTTQALIAFIESGSGEISASEYRAKNAAFFALGWLAFRSNDPAAIAYLETGLDAAFWTHRVHWLLHGQACVDTEELVRMSILGLSLTGDSGAKAALVARKNSPAGAADQDVLDQALKNLDQIKAKGLSGYYRR